MVSVKAAIEVGLLAVRAGRWEGWRKFAPFAQPLALVLGIVMGIAGAAPVPDHLQRGLAGHRLRCALECACHSAGCLRHEGLRLACSGSRNTL